jgi:dTDP-4-amino-4,6-dideoxygalactose transaminase
VSCYDIPFNRPCLVGKELEYIAQAVANGHLSGDGAFTGRCNELLAKMLGVPKVMLTTSCTHALEMAALLLDIQPGDEVIVPSFTFVSTVNAFVLRGARPVFVDSRPDTLNMDENLLEALVTPRTKAIVPVHYAGVACEMEGILEVANRFGVNVVEDNAHGLLGLYRDKNLGTLGRLATLSFHETKNFTCGEGGAIVINDLALIERAEIIREKGTNRSRFFRGQVDKYTWVDVGSSYLPSELNAAFLCAQLEQWEQVQASRRRVWHYYHDSLAEWAAAHGIGQPTVPNHCEQPYHLYYLLFPSLARRQAIIGRLKERGVSSAFHYLPLHLSDMGRRYGGRPGDCPVCEDASDRLLRLPFYNCLSEEEQARVVEGVIESYDD